MRYLGIDYGTKRVGIALSDESGTMAFPHTVLANDAELVRNVESIITKEGVQTVVVGRSIDKDEAPNPIQSSVAEFVTDLTLATGVPIHLQDERYSTQEAIRFQGRTEHTDASAAAVILNAFLISQ